MGNMLRFDRIDFMSCFWMWSMPIEFAFGWIRSWLKSFEIFDIFDNQIAIVKCNLELYHLLNVIFVFLEHFFVVCVCFARKQIHLLLTWIKRLKCKRSQCVRVCVIKYIFLFGLFIRLIACFPYSLSPQTHIHAHTKRINKLSVIDKQKNDKTFYCLNQTKKNKKWI